MASTIQSALFRLDSLFQGGKSWTARALAAELGVSGRTVNRYIERLRQDFGAPVRGGVDGYSYEKPFSLKPFELSERDLFALYSARAVLEQYRGSFLTHQIDERIEELVAGLIDRLPSEGLDLREYLSFRLSGTPVTELDSLMELLEAALLRKQLELDYGTPGASSLARRRVDPHALTARDGVWYLVAFDHRRDKMIPFNVSRIRGFRRTGRDFERDPGFELDEHFRDAFGLIKGGTPETVRIRFSPEKAHFVREREFHPTQTLTERPDGGLDYEVTIAEPTEILHFVLGFGSGAEVLSPTWLRDHMREEIRQISSKYDVTGMA